MLKVIISGGRNFDDYGLLCRSCDFILKAVDDVSILTGGATGADALGVKYSEDRGIEYDVEEAEWEKYRRSAGPIRNNKMAQMGDALIAFWDGKSPGTKNMIETMIRMGKPVRVVRLDKGAPIEKGIDDGQQDSFGW